MWNISNILLLIFDLCISIAVTIHVLFNKRNVPAAIGWIALSWFSPMIGAVLYFAFGINRIERRARTLRRTIKMLHQRVTNSALNSEPFANLKATVGALTNRNLAEAKISVPLDRKSVV